MSFQRLLVGAVAVCVLVGASTAMARNDCPDGSIVGGVLDEIVIDEFESCKIVGVIVTGSVRISDADQITVLASSVSGRFRVTNTVSAALLDNRVEGANLEAIGNAESFVVRNVVTGGTIRVNDDSCKQQQVATVVQNLVFLGNLRVDCNEKADVKENKVTDGDISCSDNDRLDSKDNDAFGGRVNCSLSLFN